MHIPDTMLQGTICPLSTAVSAAGITATTYIAYKTKIKPTPTRFAAITALIFAAQMIKFPIQHGTSGHLLGGVLATSLLGIPFGMLATSLVVLIQALFFADGGLTVLGANILNISFIGAGIGGTIHYYVYKKMIQKKIYRALSLAGAAWLSVLSAAFLCSLELSFAGTISFIKVAPAMLSIHARIGIGEAGITLIAYYIFARHEKKNLVPLATAALLAMLISPFTSSWPDGLEWVAEHYNFFHASLPHIISIWKDYTFPFITEPAISTGLAGLAGVIITFILTWSIGRLFQIPLPDILYIE